MQATIWCDKCGWRLENQSIPKWYKKPCPACNDSIPINRGDMVFYRMVQVVSVISRIIKFLCPWVHPVRVRISSKEFHDKQEEANTQ